MNKSNDLNYDIINQIIDEMKKHPYFNKVISIIVTGSLGRGEPTYFIQDDKKILKSDIEIAVVYKGSEKKIRNIFNYVIGKFNEDINFMPVSLKRITLAQNYNYTIFPSRKKTVFTFDLFNGSYTAYGKKIIENIRITNDMIDLYEAKRIVANRIAEYIYLTDNNDDEYLKLQWQCKVVLAIGSAWLILNKIYNSSYKEQYSIIAKNKEKFGNEFIDLYSRAYLFLRENGTSFTFDDNLLIKSLININKLFFDNNLNKSHVNGLSRTLKYYLRFVRKIGFDIHFAINLENKILSGIINSYISEDDDILKYSKMWHDVIY